MNNFFRTLLLNISLGCASILCAGETWKPIPLPMEEFSRTSKHGHVQGVCCSDQTIYVSQKSRLAKFSWEGKLLKCVSVTSHTGGICFHEGHIYAAVGCRGAALAKGRGLVQIYDEELNLVKEAVLPRGSGSIGVLDGVFYVGMGTDATPPKTPHRENFILRLDARTLMPLKELETFDYGFPTCHGLQGVASDGKYLFLSFYCGRKGTPGFVICDRELNVLKTLPKFSGAMGMDLVPARLRGDRKIFLRLNDRTMTLDFCEFHEREMSFVRLK